MSLSPPITTATQPPLSPAEMDLLVSRTGLTLNPGQMADLVLAWRQLAGLIAAIPQSTALADDQAFVFRLPGPPAAPAPKPKPVARAKAAPKKPVAKKPAPTKSPARKSAKPARKR